MRKEHFVEDRRARLGEGQEVHFLGRDIRRTSEAIELSMSPTFVEKILETLGMQNCRSVMTPGVDTLKKVTDAEQVSPETHKILQKSCWSATLAVKFEA